MLKIQHWILKKKTKERVRIRDINEALKELGRIWHSPEICQANDQVGYPKQCRGTDYVTGTASDGKEPQAWDGLPE